MRKLITLMAYLFISMSIYGELFEDLTRNSDVVTHPELDSNVTFAKVPSNILICGDSNTGGTNPLYTPAPHWPVVLSNYYGNVPVYVNAVSGWKLQDMEAALPTYAGIPTDDTYDVCVIFGGINNLSGGGESPATAFGNLTALVNAALADGWDDFYIVSYYGWDGYEDLTTAFNVLVKEYCDASGYTYVPHAERVKSTYSDVVNDLYVWRNDAGYFHINQRASDLLADMVYFALSGSYPDIGARDRATAVVDNYYHREIKGVKYGPATGGGFLGRKVVPRLGGVVGVTEQDYYVVFNGTYPDLDRVAAGHIGRMVGAPYGGDLYILETGTVTVPDVPLVGSVIGDSFIRGRAKVLGLTPGVSPLTSFEHGFPIAEFDFSASSTFQQVLCKQRYISRIDSRNGESLVREFIVRRGGVNAALIEPVENSQLTFETQYLTNTFLSGGYFGFRGLSCVINTDTNPAIEPLIYSLDIMSGDYDVKIKSNFD